jgi:hypothetical protein
MQEAILKNEFEQELSRLFFSFFSAAFSGSLFSAATWEMAHESGIRIFSEFLKRINCFLMQCF